MALMVDYRKIELEVPPPAYGPNKILWTKSERVEFQDCFILLVLASLSYVTMGCFCSPRHIQITERTYQL